MHLIEAKAFVVPMDRDLLEDIVNDDAKKREILNDHQQMRISNMELVDGILMVTVDIYEDYLN